MATSKVTFHEAYGEVSVAQLRAYKKWNVSPSDHDSLVEQFGEAAHQTITKAVTDPENHQGNSFSIFKFWENLRGSIW